MLTLFSQIIENCSQLWGVKGQNSDVRNELASILNVSTLQDWCASFWRPFPSHIMLIMPTLAILDSNSSFMARLHLKLSNRASFEYLWACSIEYFMNNSSKEFSVEEKELFFVSSVSLKLSGIWLMTIISIDVTVNNETWIPTMLQIINSLPYSLSLLLIHFIVNTTQNVRKSRGKFIFQLLNASLVSFTLNRASIRITFILQ